MPADPGGPPERPSAYLEAAQAEPEQPEADPEPDRPAAESAEGEQGSPSGGDPGGPGDPLPPKPEPPKPEPPVDGDPALAPGFECRLPGDSLNGAANEYGLIRLRVTPSGGSPVEILPEPYDPAHEGAPGNVFSGGAFEDSYGNSFDFGFFTGTDPDPDPLWGGADLEPLSQWDPALSGLALGDVTVQIRLVVPDGRYSPWTTIDTGVEC